MSQTALNLIAISVFLVTFSSLLGPWLHLSPLVPAIATAATLSLAAIDTWSWQGRGVNLLLDWLTRSLGGQDYAARIAHHEAGHFLVAYLLDVPITGYSLNAWEAFRQGQSGQGGVAFDTQGLAWPTEGNSHLDQAAQRQYANQLVERYCTIWMAGTVAETLVYGAATGGADDRQQFRTLWAQLGRPESEYQQQERWSSLKAKTLLQEHWTTYEALVQAMLARQSVADCCELIQQQRSPASL